MNAYTEDNWMSLAGGHKFHFTELSMGEVRIEAIAHSLAQLCRYNGHTKRFYSVGEHACLMSDWVMAQDWSTPLDGLTALHHDDAEHIIGDMVRPIKITMPEFKALEQTLDELIAKRFGTLYPLPDWLKQLDRRILVDEHRGVMDPGPYPLGTAYLAPLGVNFWTITGRWPWLTKRRFLSRHYRLTALTQRRESSAYSY